LGAREPHPSDLTRRWACLGPGRSLCGCGEILPREHSGARSMRKPRCAGCKRVFKPNPRVTDQRFCPQESCQKERRRREQKKRRRRDPDYRENEKNAQERRRQNNPRYSHSFRQTHPQYVERNRLQQRQRDRKRRGHDPSASGGVLATEAPSALASEVKSGTYELRRVSEEMLATEAALKVKISVISET
jgi:hypothetical protein